MKEELKITPEFISGIKAMLRAGLFAATSGISGWMITGTVDGVALWMAIGGALLSGVSELLHKMGKAEEEITGVPSVLTKGLSRF